MGRSLARKLIEAHLVAGRPVPGEEIALRPDQLLLTDTNGPVAFLQFEALGFPRVRARRVVAYVDHNVYQVDSRNADDHRYLESASARYGAVFSKPGNGICHQVHLETFSIPGEFLLGTDSHTPLAGGVGMLAVGAGGTDVAVAMGGAPYWLRMPAVVRVWLAGALGPWVTAKDVILELLRRLTVRGGSGKLFEFAGPGVVTLSVPERATIANMGAELGLATTVFPSDEVTRGYLGLLGREADWRPAHAAAAAGYDDQIDVDLARIEPLVALPGSPDRVVPVGEAAGTPVQQVLVGSCTNGSWEDMYAVAQVMKGQRVHPSVSLVLFPGSHRVLEVMAREGLLTDLLAAGAVVSEATCGACPGLGCVPAAGVRSLRAFNRNFPGRSGAGDDQVYLCSSVIAAASALTGRITDPRTLGPPPAVILPKSFEASSAGLVPPVPEAEAARVEVVKGPNIKPVPLPPRPAETLTAPVLLKVADGISTDDISPSGVQALLFRSNIPALAELCFRRLDPGFASRARAAGGGLIVAGEHYGQGSSREAAAAGPMALGIRAVLARSFARIHRANLINWGIVPLELDSPASYDGIAEGDRLTIPGLRAGLAAAAPLDVVNERSGERFAVRCALTPRERAILLAGGLLAYTRAALSAAPPAFSPGGEGDGGEGAG